MTFPLFPQPKLVLDLATLEDARLSKPVLQTTRIHINKTSCFARWYDKVILPDWRGYELIATVMHLK